MFQEIINNATVKSNTGKVDLRIELSSNLSSSQVLKIYKEESYGPVDIGAASYFSDRIYRKEDTITNYTAGKQVTYFGKIFDGANIVGAIPGFTFTINQPDTVIYLNGDVPPVATLTKNAGNFPASISTTNGSWLTNDGPITYTYKWKHNDVIIPNETNASYGLPQVFVDPKPIGNYVAVVTATTANKQTTTSSNTINIPARVFNTSPFLSSTGLHIGSTITVNEGYSNLLPGESILFTYKWYINNSVQSQYTTNTVVTTIPGNYKVEVSYRTLTYDTVATTSEIEAKARYRGFYVRDEFNGTGLLSAHVLDECIIPSSNSLSKWKSGSNIKILNGKLYTDSVVGSSATFQLFPYQLFPTPPAGTPYPTEAKIQDSYVVTFGWTPGKNSNFDYSTLPGWTIGNALPTPLSMGFGDSPGLPSRGFAIYIDNTSPYICNLDDINGTKQTVTYTAGTLYEGTITVTPSTTVIQFLGKSITRTVLPPLGDEFYLSLVNTTLTIGTEHTLDYFRIRSLEL